MKNLFSPLAISTCPLVLDSDLLVMICTNSSLLPSLARFGSTSAVSVACRPGQIQPPGPCESTSGSGAVSKATQNQGSCKIAKCFPWRYHNDGDGKWRAERFLAGVGV